MRELSVILCALLAGSAVAQNYPAKPIRLIAPTAPGSPPDVRARWLAERLIPALGQPIVVENRAGAAGNIGTEAAAKSAPDGYTIAIVHQGIMALNPHMYAKIGFDPLVDLVPVANIVVSAMLLAIHPTVPATSIADLVRLAKDKPGKVTFGSGGNGSPPHLAAELFRRMTGIDVVHVPYKSAVFALQDLMAGRVDFTVDGVVLQLPQVKAGRIKALAVTSPKRLASLPDIPTMIESGLAGYEYLSWMGIVAPAGTPRGAIDRLNAEINKVLATQEARDWFAPQGGEPVAGPPEQFGAFIKAEHTRWGQVIRESNIKPD